MQYQCHIATRPERGIPPGWFTRTHCHPFFELGIVKHGHCHWILDQEPDQPVPSSKARSATLKEGEAILIPPHQWHYEKAQEVPAIIEWTGISAPPEAFERISLSTPLTLEAWGPEILAATRQIFHEVLHRPYASAERIPLLVADLILLLRRVSHAIPAPRRQVRSTDHLEAARLYLEQNPEPGLSMEQVARYHGYSLSHFEVLFSQRYGATPKRFQQQQRLQTITLSIQEGLRSPKELALRHGFSDAAYFCRWFRRQTGTTPSLWQPPTPMPEADGDSYASPPRNSPQGTSH